MATKYYKGIRDAQRVQKPADELPAFNAERLRSTKLSARIASRFLEDPRWFFRLLRYLKPMVKLGPFVLVSKNADVREVLERQDVFETPFALEMTEMAGGANFILGMQDGEEYRRMKSAVLSAFPVEEMEERVRPIAAKHSREIMLRAASGFDVVDGLLKIVPVRICRDYYGLVIDDEVGFADRAIALSSLFFADPFGSPDTRELAVVAARDMRSIIDRSVEAARSGDTDPDTPLARLVAMADSKTDPLPMDHLHAIMMGMVSGFAPTNLLAAGNCLDVVLGRREVQDTIEEAIAVGDDKMLERAIVEAMRFKPINAGPFRHAKSDCTIAAGTRRAYRVKAGSTVVPLTLSAMFDADAVSDPERYDPGRPSATYLVFGHGIHWCIGAALAKIQIAEAFRVIFAKKNLRRARGKAGRLRRRGAFPESLAVTFDVSASCKTVNHAMVTMCFPVRPAVDLAELRDDIAALGNPCRGSLCEKLDETGTIHFSSMAVIGAGEQPGQSDLHPAQVVVEFSADGEARDAINQLAIAGESAMRPIFEQACGLEPETPFDAFLHTHMVEFAPSFLHDAGLAFAGTPGHSVERIRQEADLERTVSGLIGELPGDRKHSASSILRDVREKLADQGHFDWAFQPAESLLERKAGSVGAAVTGTILSVRIMTALAAIFIAGVALNYQFVLGGGMAGWLMVLAKLGAAIGLTVLGLVIIAAIILGIVLYAIRRLEKRDRFSTEQLDLDRYGEIVARENHGLQNHLTGISVIKPGLLRRAAMRFVFLLIATAARFVFRPGMLSDINTIHFARWAVLPGTNKLMFFSNYGGSWESYLEDFITKARQGLTGVWSNTLGFPPARYLFNDGAKFGDLFKRWARMQQAPTLFWYSAYPGINTRRIRTNSAIRQGIARADSESEAREWLNLFGSLPRPDNILETGEIQSILFGPMGRLDQAEMIGVHIPENISSDRRRAWLDWLLENMSFGDRKPAKKALIAAFGPDGLARLGLDRFDGFDAIGGFPSGFRQGMHHPSRSRILDDEGDNSPPDWRWGNQQLPVDAVFLCYANTKTGLSALRRSLLQQCKNAGFSEQVRIPLSVVRKNGRAIEPFGFVDGISQPVIRGTRHALGPGERQNVVEPGEFILGYRNQRQNNQLPIAVPAYSDPDMLLPGIPAVTNGAAGTDETDSLRDFGRNGSFLVLRQLEQNVADFRDFCSQAAGTLKASGDYTGPIDGEWVAAKMVGRWRDGTSLVRNHHGEAGKPVDNDFTFGAEDPQGLRCPLGSHIRRANPRDSLGEDRDKQIELTKRHRILRIGRRYKFSGKGKTEEGLLFMCLNADIERQFEFVQQTWINASAFHGLQSERDPLIGNPRKNDRFTIPGEHGGTTLTGLSQFTRLRGGGYFFLPGKSALRFLISRN